MHGGRDYLTHQERPKFDDLYNYVGDILDCPKKDNIGAGSFGKQASKCVACQTEDKRKQSGAAV